MVNFDNEVDDYKYFCEVKPFKVDVEFVSDSVESVTCWLNVLNQFYSQQQHISGLWKQIFCV